jgi:hypothetical protein
MIRRIQILPIPARREPQRSHDTIWAVSLRKRHRLVLARASRVHARVCELAEAGSFLLGAGVDIAYEHAEALPLVSVRIHKSCMCTWLAVQCVVRYGDGIRTGLNAETLLACAVS